MKYPASLTLLLVSTAGLAAQEKAPEKNEARPLLRLEAGGPTSYVTSVAFSPDGKLLYVAGYDKVVRVWKLNEATNKFALDEATSYRVPIVPGLGGAINAIAVSADGQWLAVGGFGVVAEAMKFTETGRLIPAKGGLSASMRYDLGQITVFNTRDRSVKILRGHSGPVLSLAFADKAGRPLLLSTAEGWVFEFGRIGGEATLWNVEKEKQLAEREMPPPGAFARRPGVALVGGDDPVAYLAWEDGKLVRWSPLQKKSEERDAPKYNIALDLSPGGKALLGTGELNGKGVLQKWIPPNLAPEQPMEFLRDPTAKGVNLPLAVRYADEGRLIASVTRHFIDRRPAGDVLNVRSVDGRGFAQNRALWTSPNPVLPSLAASSKHIAIGGFPDHAVQVFAIENGNVAKNPMYLNSPGATMSTVAWLAKNGARGLGLCDRERPGDPNLIFDITNSKLGPMPDGWVNDAAAPGGLALTVDAGKWTLANAGAVLSKGELREGEITATAVAPAITLDVPLVALASFHAAKGSTLLEIINGKTGETLRRYSGHTAPIRSVSFRADGKLLASAGQDQTVVVWSLVDLGDVLGKFGALGDLAAETRGKELVVLDSAGVKGIEKNDIITGIVNKAGVVVPLTKSADFYERLWMRKPGSTAKLKITRAKMDIEVEATVQQGVDVRKPLFTLFFPKDANGAVGADWIGWNAIGPYDASRKAVERYLGWHFNTGKPDRPTSFAFIDQYRKEYFRPGVLKEMIDLGDLPPPPKLPAPKPVLLIPGVAEDGVLLTKFGASYLVRKKSFDLHVTIPGYDALPGDELTWQLDDGPVQTFPIADANLWTAKVDWPEGGARSRKIVVRMKRSPEGWPVENFETTVQLSRVFPSPKIQLVDPKTGAAIKTDKGEITIKYGVLPGSPAMAFSVFESHYANGKWIADKKSDAKAGQRIDSSEKYTLEPGLNLIRVRAVNENTFVGVPESDESATTTFEVTYVEKKSPPAIFMKSVLVPNAEPAPANGLVQVAVGRVKFVGRIESESPVTTAEWILGEKRMPIELSKTGEFSIDVALQPGVQDLRVTAKNAKGLESTDRQVVSYLPPLPALVVTSPEEGFAIADKSAFVEVHWPTPEAPLDAMSMTVEAVVSSDGKLVGRGEVKVKLGDGKAVISAAPLAPGNNAILIRMRSPESPYGSLDRVVEVRGRRVLPPKIAALTTSPVGKTPFVDVIAETFSSQPPTAPLIAVKVNGATVRPASVEFEKIGEDLWRITAKQTPLPAVKGKAIKCDIALSLATADGVAAAALKEPVVVKLPLPPAPAIFLLEPGLRESTVPELTTKLRFQVTSETPLTRVDVLRGETLVRNWLAPKATADGVYELFLPDVGLDYGLNPLSIVAVNEGGQATSQLTVNVPPQPVRLELDSVQIAPNGLTLKPGVDGGFAPLPAGRLMLHGSVQWNPSDDAKIDRAKAVRVYVNGYQQLPAELKAVAGKPRTKTFSIPVVLGHSDNQIEIELPELKQDAANRRKLSLACLTPVRGQQLHILVIAPQETNEAKLIENLARGMKAELVSGNVYKTPVYEAVRIHVLAKHVQLLEISSRLDRIAESLRDRAKAGNPNDLVLIYFQGKETNGASGPVLWTSETAPWLQLSLGDLAKNYLSRFSGGQLLILDTISPTGDVDLAGMRFAAMRRPDPRPLAERPRLSAELEKEMPRVVWLDQLNTVLGSQMRPSFQSYLPESLRNKIQLNP